jgi:hypothetical protein
MHGVLSHIKYMGCGIKATSSCPFTLQKWRKCESLFVTMDALNMDELRGSQICLDKSLTRRKNSPAAASLFLSMDVISDMFLPNYTKNIADTQMTLSERSTHLGHWKITAFFPSFLLLLIVVPSLDTLIYMAL